MRFAVLAGLAVFAAVYSLLALPRLGRRLREAAERRWGRAGGILLSRPGIALAGAALVVLLLQVTPLDAWRAIDWRTLSLLTGMMLLVAALDVANVFEVLAARLVQSLRTPLALLAGSMAAVAVLSALVLNDAVVLLFTPVLIRAAAAMGVSPIPYLVGEAIAANLGSVAAPTGNPQNAAIASARDMSYLSFTLPLLPLALVGLALGVAVCAVAFARELRHARPPTPATAAPRITHRRLLTLSIAAVVAALGGAILGPTLGIPLWASALAAGALVLALAPAARADPRAIAGRVDVGILAFFVGLFVLLEVVKQSGALAPLAEATQRAGSAGLIGATAILSNVVSNVPAVLLLLPTIGTDAQALLLAASSTYAGNATFLGSAATVIVAETARHHGADFSVLKFTLVGLPIAIATLALTWLMLG